MGNTSVYPVGTQCQTLKQTYHDRVLRSIMAMPINIECLLPLGSKSSSPSYDFSSRGKNKSLKPRVSVVPMPCDADQRASLSNEWPFTAHVRLEVAYPGKTCVGSGTCIGSRFVLTAASNVFYCNLRREVKRSKFSIQLVSMANSCVSGIRVIEIYYSKKFLRTGEEDFALLVLNKDIVETTGCFGLKSISYMELAAPFTYLCGYGSRFEELEKENLVVEKNDEINIDRNLIHHNMDSTKLQNGAVVCRQENSNYYVIGIHNSAESQADPPRVLYLNASRVQKIESWIRKYYMKYSIITSLDLSLMKFPISDLLLQFPKGLISNLASLDLKGSCIGPKGARMLAKRRFESLRFLNLDRNALGSQGARNIAIGKLSSLTRLSLGENEIGPEGARDLSHGNLRNLQELDLFKNNIGNEGAILLANGKLSTLISLNLRDNNLGPLAAKGLAKGNLKNLKTLNLADNTIGNDGAFELSQGNLINVHTLDVSSNEISSEGAAALSHGKLVELTVLNIDHNYLGYKAISRLARGNARKLSRVYTLGNRYGEETYTDSSRNY
jgi:Ran GTPase-activating protein (RanGAP) involved in mRNA processing and transport